MRPLDELKEKEEYTDLESVIVTYSVYEKKARGDEVCPSSNHAAAELAALIKDRDDYKRAYESALGFYERLLTADRKLENCPACGSKLNWCTECEKRVGEA